MPSLPFSEDPYDAVTSFGVIAIAIVGGATVVRWIAQLRRRPDDAVERRIAIGAAIVSVIAAVGVASDVVALAIVGVPAMDGAVLLTAGLIVATGVVCAIALASVWAARSELLHGPRTSDGEPDLLDDLESIAGSLGAAGASARVSRWVETSPVQPAPAPRACGSPGGRRWPVSARSPGTHSEKARGRHRRPRRCSAG